jgi:hypothetical protein
VDSYWLTARGVGATQGRKSGPKGGRGGGAHLASAKGHIVGVRGHAPQILN